MDKRIKKDDRVKVHYTGTLVDGTTFDTSRQREPLEFTVGGGELIKGFDEAVVGMSVGETKTIHIPAEQAYGPHRAEMVLELDRSQFPNRMNPRIGQQLQTQTADGHPVTVLVTEVNDSKVTLDANHPLAGKDLTFEIEVAAIE